MKEQSHCTPGASPGATEKGETVSIYVDHNHPLLQLKRALPWEALCEVMTRHWRRATRGLRTGRPCRHLPRPTNTSEPPRIGADDEPAPRRDTGAHIRMPPFAQGRCTHTPGAPARWWHILALQEGTCDKTPFWNAVLPFFHSELALCPKTTRKSFLLASQCQKNGRFLATAEIHPLRLVRR